MVKNLQEAYIVAENEGIELKRKYYELQNEIQPVRDSLEALGDNSKETNEYKDLMKVYLDWQKRINPIREAMPKNRDYMEKLAEDIRKLNLNSNKDPVEGI